MGMPRSLSLVVYCILVVLLGGASEAGAARMFQATSWVVTRNDPGNGAAPACQAKASFVLPLGEFSLFDATFVLGANGPLTLRVNITEPVPEWMEFYGNKPTGRETVKGCRAWFDDGAMWPMEYTLDRETGVERFDLGEARGMVASLAEARFLKMETKPGAVVEEQDQRIFTNDQFDEYELRNTAALARQLRSCQATLGRDIPVAPVTVYDASGPAPAAVEPMPARLAAARQASRQTPADDPDARAMALLRLGQAAADALRLGEAREAFEGLRTLLANGMPLTPTIRRGLERLVEVLVLSERLDEAFDVAKTLPQNEELLAAIALSRGDYAGAEQLLCAAASRILGIPVKNWLDLSMKRISDFRMEIVGGLAQSMRRLCLLWGMAALGQEKALIGRHCGSCVDVLNHNVPACAAGNQMFNWVDGDMLREGAPDTAAARRDLGLAAYLQGASLLRAGYLLTVKSSLAYALYELAGPSGADGWAMRARVALAGLTAAQARPREALDEIKAVAAGIEAALGRESLSWIEAAALESEVSGRLGEQAEAMAAARAGLAAAGQLPPQHSLVLRLKRTLSLGLLGQGKIDEAAQVATNALGMRQIPSVEDKQLLAVFEKFQAVQEPPSAPPIVPTNGAELKRMLQRHQQDRSAFGKLTRSRHDIVAAVATLPSMPGNFPVAARYERVNFISPLSGLIDTLKDTRKRNGARLIRLALTLDESRAEARLEGSGVAGGLTYADDLIRVASGETMLDGIPVRPGVSPFLGIKVESVPLYFGAMDWLSLSSMFPGEHRQYLLPGKAVAGLEHLLAALYKLWQSPEASKENLELHEALVHALASTRGEVLGNLLTRVVLVGDASLEPEYRHDSQQAIDGELWLRRQRSRLLDLVAQNDPATPRVSHAREGARRLAMAQPYLGSFVGNKFFSHVYSNQEAQKGFESLTWFGSPKYEFKIEQTQQRLEQDEALVAWLPLDSCTHVFVIKKNTCAWRIVPQGRAALGARVGSIRGSIRDFLAALHDPHGDPLAKPFPEGEAYALYQALFGPIEEVLAGVTHLYAVQMGVVGGIPLGLLPTQPPTANREPDRLVDRFALTRMPTLVNPAILARERPSSPRPGHLLLAAGDPLAGSETPPANTPLIASIRSVRSLDRRLPRLRETKQEIETVADLMGLSAADKQEHILSGAKATPSSILGRLTREKFKYLLFATHGLVGKEDIDVGEPALVLSPETGQRSAGDDGLLRASDIVGLDLDTDLVLLSACETSPSGEDGAEPLAGLASAFLVAGARTVLSTQWAVVSDAAQTVSTEMVSGLGAGKPQPARVLRQVIERLRTQATPHHLERHPGYWAPFEVIAFPR